MDADLLLSDNTMIKIDGAAVRRLRETKGLTQLYVATVVGVTTDTISRWENKRYQTIKRGNAVKLAESLEVELNDILDLHDETMPTEEEKETESASDHPPTLIPLPTMADNRAWKIGGGIVLGVLLFGFGIWFATSQQQLPTSVVANRHLPSASPPGQVFPVVIEIRSPATAEPISLIIQEQLPLGIIPVKSFPPYTTYDAKTGVIKWLQKTSEQKLSIIYLAKITEESRRQQKLVFDGQITRKGRKPAPFTGLSSSIEVAPYHWADVNRDRIISDEEILAANDAFGDIDEIDADFNLLESIWSGNGYTWDEEKQRYIVLP